MNETSDKTELRTVDDFIAFFSAIPEERWCVGSFRNHLGQRCAHGFLLPLKDPYADRCLSKLFKDRFGLDACISTINDGVIRALPQFTPKARILAALHEIKSHQEKE